MFPAILLATAVALVNETKEISPGIYMHRINMGTCCGSDTTGLPGWLAAGGRGIDTAYDYGKQVSGGLQADLAKAIEEYPGVSREDVFITTKIPAGLGLSPQDCRAATVESTVEEVKRNLRELNTSYVDLTLLHAPCRSGTGGTAANAILWKGLEEAHKQGLSRAIGVSNYKQPQLAALLAEATTKPAVNQCELSVGHHDDETIAYCKAQGITYEAYEAMRGCPFSNAQVTRRAPAAPELLHTRLARQRPAGLGAAVLVPPHCPIASPPPQVQAIAKSHGVGVSQVCLRWVLQKGAIMAVGIGANVTKMPTYAAEDLALYGFKLTESDMALLDSIGAEASQVEA